MKVLRVKPCSCGSENMELCGVTICDADFTVVRCGECARLGPIGLSNKEAVMKWNGTESNKNKEEKEKYVN